MKVCDVALIFCLGLAALWLVEEAGGTASSSISDSELWVGPGPFNETLLARIKEYQCHSKWSGDICKLMSNKTWYISLVVPGYLYPGIVNCSYTFINCTEECGGTAYFYHVLNNGSLSYRNYSLEEHFTSFYLKARSIYHYVVHLEERFAIIYAWNKNSSAANKYIEDVINIKVLKGFELNKTDYIKIDAICEHIFGYKCTSKLVNYTNNCTACTSTSN